MKYLKKSFDKIILTIAIIFSLSIGFANFQRNAKNTKDSSSPISADPAIIPFVYGAMNLPDTIDPQDCWDIIQMTQSFRSWKPCLHMIMATQFYLTFHCLPVILALGMRHTPDILFLSGAAYLYNFTGTNMGYIPGVHK